MKTKHAARSLILGLLVATLGCSAGDARPGRTAPIRTAPVKAEPDALRETEAFVAAEPLGAGAATPPGGGDGTRLAYSHVAVTVRGGSVVTHVTDVIANDGPAPLDFAYTFPLPDDARVSELAYFSAGKRVRAAAQEKAEAKATFEAAKARGDSATLSENTTNSRFSVSLTPLAAGESRRVELEYVQSLDSFGAQRSFAFPAAHSARRGEPILDFHVDIEGEAEVSDVASLNHVEARVVTLGPKSARVLLSMSEAPLGQDLVVRWSERSEPQQLALRATAGAADEPGYGQVDFSFNADSFAAQQPGRQFVFVVDTSLSMAGEALEHGKRLVERALGHLTERDRLALVLFDDQLSSWNELLPASAANKERALRELRPKRASGLSNVDAAIDRARELTSNASSPVLILITDGQSTVGEKPDELLPASKPADFSATRVFVAQANYPSRQPALRALFPGATLRFMPSGEAGRQAADAMARLIAAPMLENVKVEVEGLDEQERYGATPTRLALGDRIRLLGRLTGATFKARVSATLHGSAIELEQTATLSNRPSDNAALPREWARSKLTSLEARFDAERDVALKNAAIDLAKRFGLVSSFTSLVATDSLSPDRVAPGDPELRIAAPRSASSVVAVLPWGGEVQCEWDDTEGSWLGRFLVPRAVSDGLHKIPVFSTIQGKKQRRSTLLLRVDSKAPRYRLRATTLNGALELLAEPEAEVFDKSGDTLRLDLMDVKHVSVELGGRAHELSSAGGGTWSGRIALPGAGAHVVSLVASDYAQNSSRSRHRVVVSKSGAVAVAELDSKSTSAKAPEPAASQTELVAPFLPGNVSALATFDGSLVVATFDAGIFTVDAHGKAESLRGAPRFVNALLAEPDQLLIGSTKGLSVLSHAELRRVPLPSASAHVNGMARAKDGTLWLATSNGLIALRAGSFRHLDERHGLPSRIVYAVAEGAGGILWAGTAAGVARISPAGVETFSIETGALPHRWVTSLLPEASGVWVGTYQGGITQLGPRGPAPLAGTAQLWLNPHGIARIGEQLYAATMGDGLVTIQRDGRTTRLGPLPSDDVTAVQAFAGALWVGTRGGLARLAPDPQ